MKGPKRGGSRGTAEAGATSGSPGEEPALGQDFAKNKPLSQTATAIFQQPWMDGGSLECLSPSVGESVRSGTDEGSEETSEAGATSGSREKKPSMATRMR